GQHQQRRRLRDGAAGSRRSYPAERRVTKVIFPQRVVGLVYRAAVAVAAQQGALGLAEVVTPSGVVGGVHEAVAVEVAGRADGGGVGRAVDGAAGDHQPVGAVVVEQQVARVESSVVDETQRRNKAGIDAGAP